MSAKLDATLTRLGDLIEEDIILRRADREDAERARRKDLTFKLTPQPRRLGVATVISSLPGFGQQFSAIPPEFWFAEEEGTAVVACPCKAQPEPRVESGQIEQCGCERFYVFTGKTVLVANGPQKDQQPTPVVD